MARSLDKSNAHFRRAVRKLPLGVSSNFRYWGDDKTLYVKTSQGARIWDLDGNEYIDYRLGYGPVILGHRHPEVDAAAREGQEVGTVFAMSTEREVVVAELVSEMVEAAELVRFSNSGTEAVMGALRLARGATGRDGYVILEGSYHGLFDAVMWQADVESMTDVSREPDVLPFGKGVPGLIRDLFWHVPYNDAGRLDDASRRQRDLGADPVTGDEGDAMAHGSSRTTRRRARWVGRAPGPGGGLKSTSRAIPARVPDR